MELTYYKFYFEDIEMTYSSMIVATLIISHSLSVTYNVKLL